MSVLRSKLGVRGGWACRAKRGQDQVDATCSLISQQGEIERFSLLSLAAKQMDTRSQ